MEEFTFTKLDVSRIEMRHRDRSGLPRSLGAIRALGLAAVVTGAAACSDAPTEAPVSSAPSADVGAPATANTARHDMLADASDRLAASVEDLVARSQLQASLRALDAALEAGDRPAAQRALSRARKAAAAVGADAVDIAMIGLALDQIDAELGNTDVSK